MATVRLSQSMLIQTGFLSGFLYMSYQPVANPRVRTPVWSLEAGAGGVSLISCRPGGIDIGLSLVQAGAS